MASVELARHIPSSGCLFRVKFPEVIRGNEGFEHNLSVLFEKRELSSLSVNVVRNPWIYAAMPPLWPQSLDCDYNPWIAITIL